MGHEEDISIVIQVGVLGGLIRSVTDNIAATCGYDINDLDIVLVIDQDPDSVTPYVEKELERAVKKYPSIRIVEYPGQATRIGCCFVSCDWLPRTDPKLRSKIVFQHADLYHIEPNWLRIITNHLLGQDNIKVLACYGSNVLRYTVDHVLYHWITDVLMVCDKAFLIEEDLRNSGGRIRHGTSEGFGFIIPENLFHKIAAGRVGKFNTTTIPEDDDRLFSVFGIKDEYRQLNIVDEPFDGTNIISLAMAEYPDAIKAIQGLHFVHPWGVVRAASAIAVDDDGIAYIKSPISSHPFILARTSYFLSMCMDYDDTKDRLIPLSIALKVFKMIKDHASWERLMGHDNMLKQYRKFLYYPDYKPYGAGPAPHIKKVVLADGREFDV